MEEHFEGGASLLVSANQTFPREKEFVARDFRPPAKKTLPVLPPVGLHARRSEGNLLGISSLLFVASFLGLTVYLVIRYLL